MALNPGCLAALRVQDRVAPDGHTSAVRRFVNATAGCRRRSRLPSKTFDSANVHRQLEAGRSGLVLLDIGGVAAGPPRLPPRALMELHDNVAA